MSPESRADRIISCLVPGGTFVPVVVRGGVGVGVGGEGGETSSLRHRRVISFFWSLILAERADLENAFARRKIATVGRNIGSVRLGPFKFQWQQSGRSRHC